MAFLKIESCTMKSMPQEYICVSSDTKKTVNISVGSTAYETDTKNVYIFNGTTWVLM
jgi:hypothetical protein